MKLTMVKKLILLFVLGLLSFSAIGYMFYSYNPLRILSGVSRESDYSVLKALVSIRSGLADLEEAEHDFTLSGNESTLKGFRDSSAALRRNIAELRAQFANATGQQRKLDDLESLVTRRIMFTKQIIDARKKRGRQAADAPARAGGGRQLAAQIETAASELERDGLRMIAYQDMVLGKNLEQGVSLIAAAYGVAVAVIIVSISIMRREFLRYRRTRKGLQEYKEQFRLFIEEVKGCAIFALDREGRVKNWNARAEHLYGYQAKDIIGRHFSILYPGEDTQLRELDQSLKRAETDGRFENMSWRMRKDGSTFEAHSVVASLKDRKGQLRGFSVVTRNITEIERTEELLQKLSLSIEQAADLVVITDREGKVEYVNKAVEDLTGYARDEFTAGGMDLLQVKEDGKLYREIRDQVLSGRSYQTEVAYIKKSGDLFYLDEVVTPVKDAGGDVTHVVITGSDVTHVKRMRDKLDYLALYDALTGLPNRNLFTDRLGRDAAPKGKGKGPLAVLAIDIDRFKYINEIYGLDAGNKVLKQVAESLSVSVNKGDTVGRLGSDEFGIVLHGIGRPADAVLFVKMIMKNLPQIIMAGGQEISVTLAVGIAVYPEDGEDAQTLMKNADTAITRAKALGRNRYQFYTTDMNVGVSELVFMERRLFDALKNREYTLTYQPYCHLATRRVAGTEALLKWKSDEFGLVSPAKFIPMLEETGMIIDVGKWVLRTACRQIREWDNGTSFMPVAVNLSPSQFRHEHLAETVAKTVREFKIDPRRLTLEITESTFMKDQEFAVSVLRKLKEIGVSISIDDFGTGYSSLSYLKRFPVDSIKIDHSFIKDVTTDPDATSLVTAIINMAHSLNLTTIAEGVETEEQWKILRLLKCDMAQGYYFSHALPAKECEKYLEKAAVMTQR